MGLRDGGTTSPALLNRLVDWRDDAAWREFVERYRPLIQVWCRRMRLDADTTEELCQRIWINLAHRRTRSRAGALKILPNLLVACQLTGPAFSTRDAALGFSA
jgi:hypothetical protein